MKLSGKIYLLFLLTYSLIFLNPAQRCYGFGDNGHQGIYNEALKLLKASDQNLCSTRFDDRFSDACFYPDAAVNYSFSQSNETRYEINLQLPNQYTKIWIDLNLTPITQIPYLLNSSDHYFDPKNPNRVAYFAGQADSGFQSLLADASAEALMASHPILINLPKDFRDQAKKTLSQQILNILKQNPNILSGQGRTYDEFKDNKEGTRPCPGADGDGYNAIISILFYLNGRANGNDSSNPSGLSPTKGFVSYARDQDMNQAMICLGASIHYVEDLFSPGHTVWNSWIPDPLNLHPTHGEFDKLGDSFFEDQVYPFVPVQAGHKAKLQALLQESVPVPILSFSASPNPCTLPGGKFIIIPDTAWQTDLLSVLRQMSVGSHSIWEDKSRLWKDGGLLGNGSFHEDFVNNFSDQIRDSVTVCSGVIDWAFSRAAKSDGPYKRDATNFYGMATALMKHPEANAVLLPEAFSNNGNPLECSLGGIDQDDYYPVSANGRKYSSISINLIEPEETIKAQIFQSNDKPVEAVRISPQIISFKIQNQSSLFDKPFLLRVFSPEKKSVKYFVKFEESVMPIPSSTPAVNPTMTPDMKITPTPGFPISIPDIKIPDISIPRPGPRRRGDPDVIAFGLPGWVTDQAGKLGLDLRMPSERADPLYIFFFTVLALLVGAFLWLTGLLRLIVSGALALILIGLAITLIVMGEFCLGFIVSTVLMAAPVLGFCALLSLISGVQEMNLGFIRNFGWIVIIAITIPVVTETALRWLFFKFLLDHHIFSLARSGVVIGVIFAVLYLVLGMMNNRRKWGSPGISNVSEGMLVGILFTLVFIEFFYVRKRLLLDIVITMWAAHIFVVAFSMAYNWVVNTLFSRAAGLRSLLHALPRLIFIISGIGYIILCWIRDNPRPLG